MTSDRKAHPEESDVAVAGRVEAAAATDLGDTRDTVTSSPSMANSGRVPGLQVEVGQVINGKYRVDGILGEGGVGVVVSAQHLELDERVALKFLKGDALGDAGLVARFAREAKAAVSIKSEHVARILDVGTMGPARIPFIVMEYLDGTDLRTAGQLYGLFSVSDTAEYSLHVCEALAMAHANGIIHRDIKPDNLFLTTNPKMPALKTVKVLDFGISKAALTGSVFQQDMPLIHTVQLMGTPLYMSPEQVRLTSEADARSDIWSLGMVMYEMLLGRTAFRGASVTELCAAILERDVPPIREQRPEVPEALALVVERCLEKDPAKRFQNVGELALALLPLAPKRARSCAERAVGVLRACGIFASDTVFESMAPPPPPTTPSPLAVPGRVATLGSFTLQTGVSASQREPTPPAVRSRWAQAAVLSAVVAGVLAIVSFKIRSAPVASGTVPDAQSATVVAPEPSAVARASAASPAPTATPTPIPPLPPPQPPEPTATELVPHSTPGATSPHGKRVGPKPPGKPPPSAGQRATSGDPDLGY